MAREKKDAAETASNEAPLRLVSYEERGSLHWHWLTFSRPTTPEERSALQMFTEARGRGSWNEDGSQWAFFSKTTSAVAASAAAAAEAALEEGLDAHSAIDEDAPENGAQPATATSSDAADVLDNFTTPPAVFEAMYGSLVMSSLSPGDTVAIISNSSELADLWRERHGNLFNVLEYDAPDLDFDADADETYHAVLVHASLNGTVYPGMIVDALCRLPDQGQLVAVVPESWQSKPVGDASLLRMFFSENLLDYTHVTTPLPAGALSSYYDRRDEAVLYAVLDSEVAF